MGFFDDISKKMNETKNSFVATTGKIERENKLKKDISNNEVTIQNTYNEIGKKVYESVDNINDINEYLHEKKNYIDSLIASNADMKKEILVLNNKKICSNCSAEIDLEATFCPQCGKEQEKIEQKPEFLPKGKKRCAGCNEIIDEKVSFCPLCGAQQKIEEEKVEETTTEDVKSDEQSSEENNNENNQD